MKKALTLFTVFCMLLSFAACGKKEEPANAAVNVPDEVVEPAPVEETFEDILAAKAKEERPTAKAEDNGYLAPASDGSMYGYIDVFGSWVIEPQFSEAFCFCEDTAPVLDRYSEYVQIDRSGDVVINHIGKLSMSSAEHFHEGQLLVTLDNGYEQNKLYIQSDGKTQIDASKLPQTSGVKYESKKYFSVATCFRGGVAVGMRRTNASVLSAHDNDYAKVAKKKYYQSACVIDERGKVLAELPAGLDIFKYSLDALGNIIVKDMTVENGLFGLCNISGDLVTECKYYMIEYCKDGLYLACTADGFWGYLDKDGNTVIDFKYQTAYPFSSGLAAVKEKDLFGFINTKGEYVIEPKWDDVGLLDFADLDTNFGRAAFCGVAAVKYGDYWALIDSEGNVVDVMQCYAKECPYSNAAKGYIAFHEYKNGFPTGYTGLINQKGELLLQPQYSSIGLFN